MYGSFKILGLSPDHSGTAAHCEKRKGKARDPRSLYEVEQIRAKQRSCTDRKRSFVEVLAQNCAAEGADSNAANINSLLPLPGLRASQPRPAG